MNLKIMLFQEWPVPIQIFLEIGVAIQISFICGLWNFWVVKLHMPAKTIVVLIAGHIMSKAFVPVFFGTINAAWWKKSPIRNITFQNVIVAKNHRAKQIYTVNGKIHVNWRDPEFPHAIDVDLIIYVPDKTFQNRHLLTLICK